MHIYQAHVPSKCVQDECQDVDIVTVIEVSKFKQWQRLYNTFSSNQYQVSYTKEKLKVVKN